MTRNIVVVNPSNIFRTVSTLLRSPTRINVLKYLNDNPNTRYGELFKSQNEWRSGLFIYHLKWLVQSNLVKQNNRTRLYSLTYLGFDCIDFIKRIEQREAGVSVLDEKGMFRPVKDSKMFITFIKNAAQFYEENIEDDGR